MSDGPPDRSWESHYLADAGLMVTLKCQVACPHCVVEASPDRTEVLALADAADWIEQIAAYQDGRIRSLSLTGGEPFYDLTQLSRISSLARAHGLFVSAVTNAFWASGQKRALEILADLPAIGMLAISSDEHHQRQIPFERVQHAVAAAIQCSIPYTVVVCTESKEDLAYQGHMHRLAEIVDPRHIATVITFPAGRAQRHVEASRYQRSPTPAPSPCLAANAPVLFPDGRVVACIGPVMSLTFPHPLALGSLRQRSLGEILDDAEINPILHTLRIWGPRKLLSLATEAGLADCLPDSYVAGSVCFACYWLMSNPRLVDFMADLAEGPEWREKVAYARIYYLHETAMAEHLGLIT